MNIQWLKSYLMLAHCENLTDAAEELNYSKSTLHDQMRKLQTECKIQLYTRAPFGITLTKEGEVFCSYAEKIVKCYEEAMDAMQEVHQRTITVWSSSIMYNLIVSDLLADFNRAYPSIYASLITGSSLMCVEKFIPIRLDIGFICGVDYPRGNFQVHSLQDEDLIFVTYPDNPILRSKDAVCTLASSFPSTYVENKLSCMGATLRSQFTSYYHVIGFEQAKGFALSKRGAAVLPAWSVDSELHSGSLTEVSNYPSIKLDKYVLTRMQPDPVVDKILAMVL